MATVLLALAPLAALSGALASGSVDLQVTPYDDECSRVQALAGSVLHGNFAWCSAQCEKSLAVGDQSEYFSMLRVSCSSYKREVMFASMEVLRLELGSGGGLDMTYMLCVGSPYSPTCEDPRQESNITLGGCAELTHPTRTHQHYNVCYTGANDRRLSIHV